MFKALAVLLTVILGGHAFLFYSFSRFFTIQNQFLLGLVLTILALGFIVASILVRISSNWAFRFFYLVTSLWYGLMVFLIMASVLLWVLYAIGHFFSPPSLERLHPVLVMSLYLCAVLITLYGYVRATQIKVTGITVPMPHLSAAWQNQKILQLSDLHLGPISGETQLRQLELLIQTIQPQMIVITGDLFDGTARPTMRLIGELKKITAPKGVYYISGNHELYNQFFDETSLLKDSKIIVLDNDIVSVDGLLVIGVQPPKFHEKHAAGFDIKNHPLYQADLPKLLLYHSPTDIADVVHNNQTSHHKLYLKPNTTFQTCQDLKINLQLSGHTHDGQFWPFTWLTRMIFGRFSYGLNRINDFYIYTSSGTGTWGPPLRLGSRSEVVAIVIKDRDEDEE